MDLGTVIARELVEFDPWQPGVTVEQVTYEFLSPCGCIEQTVLFDGEPVRFSVESQCAPHAQAAEDALHEEEARREQEAELANERWFENRGWAEARAQEDYEARMGIMYLTQEVVV